MNAKAISRVLIAAAGIALSAACYDDPVALTESEQPSPFDDLPQVAASSGASSGITVFDNFRPRFKVDFSVSGAMTPGATVTMTLAGEAVENLAEGTVTVVLPTMASMDHAGPNKRPNYPAGQSLPVVRSYSLRAMSAGDTWRQTFSVTLPGDAGYYHLAVAVTATAPATAAADPFVVGDDLYFERWMLVKDAGGRLTMGFDESVFSSGIAPIPGPLRAKAGRNTAGAAAAMTTDGDFGVMYSSSPVRLNVTYLGLTWTVTAARRAIVTGVLWEGSGSDVEQVASYTRTVGSSGIVSFPCPSTGQWLSGSAHLPGDASVVQQDFVGYWDAYPSDCGETLATPGPRQAYIPWDHLKIVGPRITGHFNISVPAIDFAVDGNHEVRSSYDPDEHKINFGNTYVNKWTAAHEYAHGAHEKALGGLWEVESACATHAIWVVSGYKCALLEGIADYLAQHGANWSMTYFDYPSDDSPHPKTEGWIAALFRDLIDSTTDGDDNTNYTAPSIATAFRTCNVKHGSSWDDIDDVSDFVWCLEDRINTGEHNEHFPGITAPNDVRATRGSGWSASAIRATWLQNLTND